MENKGITGFEHIDSASFESFHSYLPGCPYAYRASIAYANHPSDWLALLGPSGCGKTHLALSIAKRRIGAGDTVLFQTVSTLLAYFRSAFSPYAEQNDGEQLERFKQMKRVDLLVLDDYGAQNDTPWATEKLFQLLNHRSNGEFATVITSNHMTLEGIDPRIYSRLQDRELVTIVRMEDARDYRIWRDREE